MHGLHFVVFPSSCLWPQILFRVLPITPGVWKCIVIASVCKWSNFKHNVLFFLVLLNFVSVWIRIYISALRLNVSLHTYTYCICSAVILLFHAIMIDCVDSQWKFCLHAIQFVYLLSAFSVVQICLPFLIFHEPHWPADCKNYHHCGKCVAQFRLFPWRPWGKTGKHDKI